MVSVPIKKATIDYDYSELDGFKITVEVGGGYTHSANTIKKLIDSGKPMEFTIKKPEEDKTQKQLGSAWAAMREMADALGVPKDEIYRHMIRDYGKSTVVMVPLVDAERVIELHSSASNGNFGEVMGKAQQDKNCAIVQLWWGLSSYNKEEMSAFLDGLVKEHDEMFEE